MVKKPAKLRNTKHLTAVFDILEKTSGPISAVDIIKKAKRRSPEINKTTVYRILEKLVSERSVEAIMLKEGALHYEKIRGEKHHHHFVCSSCTKVYCIDSCASGIDKMTPKGFIITNHEITLRGVCKSCN